MRDGQLGTSNSFHGEDIEDATHGIPFPRDHHLLRAVVGCQGDVQALGSNQVTDSIIGSEDGHHLAAGGELLHELASQRDEFGALLKRKDTGNAGGRVLSDTVPHDHVGFDAP